MEAEVRISRVSCSTPPDFIAVEIRCRELSQRWEAHVGLEDFALLLTGRGDIKGSLEVKRLGPKSARGSPEERIRTVRALLESVAPLSRSPIMVQCLSALG